MPSYSTLLPYTSLVSFTGWPMWMLASCGSLKFAFTHICSVGMIAMSGVPGLTRCPSWTLRLVTTPFTGATTRVRPYAR